MIDTEILQKNGDIRISNCSDFAKALASAGGMVDTLNAIFGFNSKLPDEALHPRARLYQFTPEELDQVRSAINSTFRDDAQEIIVSFEELVKRSQDGLKLALIQHASDCIEINTEGVVSVRNSDDLPEWVRYADGLQLTDNQIKRAKLNGAFMTQAGQVIANTELIPGAFTDTNSVANELLAERFAGLGNNISQLIEEIDPDYGKTVLAEMSVEQANQALDLLDKIQYAIDDVNENGEPLTPQAIANYLRDTRAQTAQMMGIEDVEAFLTEDIIAIRALLNYITDSQLNDDIRAVINALEGGIIGVKVNKQDPVAIDPLLLQRLNSAGSQLGMSPDKTEQAIQELIATGVITETVMTDPELQAGYGLTPEQLGDSLRRQAEFTKLSKAAVALAQVIVIMGAGIYLVANADSHNEVTQKQIDSGNQHKPHAELANVQGIGGQSGERTTSYSHGSKQLNNHTLAGIAETQNGHHSDEPLLGGVNRTHLGKHSHNSSNMDTTQHNTTLVQESQQTAGIHTGSYHVGNGGSLFSVLHNAGFTAEELQSNSVIIQFNSSGGHGTLVTSEGTFHFTVTDSDGNTIEGIQDVRYLQPDHHIQITQIDGLTNRVLPHQANNAGEPPINQGGTFHNNETPLDKQEISRTTHSAPKPPVTSSVQIESRESQIPENRNESSTLPVQITDAEPVTGKLENDTQSNMDNTGGIHRIQFEDSDKMFPPDTNPILIATEVGSIVLLSVVLLKRKLSRTDFVQNRLYNINKAISGGLHPLREYMRYQKGRLNNFWLNWRHGEI